MVLPSPNFGGDTNGKLRIRARECGHLTSHHRYDSPLTFYLSVNLYTVPGKTDNTAQRPVVVFKIQKPRSKGIMRIFVILKRKMGSILRSKVLFSTENSAQLKKWGRQRTR